MPNTLSVLYARWKTESPVIFKKIVNAGVTLGTTGAVMVITPNLPAEAMKHIPAIIPTLGGYFIVAGYFSSFIAKLTCKDTTNLPQP